jgi:hypothetical protein
VPNHARPAPIRLYIQISKTFISASRIDENYKTLEAIIHAISSPSSATKSDEIRDPRSSIMRYGCSSEKPILRPQGWKSCPSVKATILSRDLPVIHNNQRNKKKEAVGSNTFRYECQIFDGQTEEHLQDLQV